MNKILGVIVLFFSLNQVFAKDFVTIDTTKRWILANNRIDYDEIHLIPFQKSKLTLNTLVLQFAENGKIRYDYETNSKFGSNSEIKYLDINTSFSAWEIDTVNQLLLLTIQAGYETFDDFRFKRSYKIEQGANGLVLKQVSEEFFADLRKESQASVGTLRKPLATPLVQVDYFEKIQTLFDKSKKWILVRNRIERGDIQFTTYDESKLTINNLVMSWLKNGKIEYEYESDPKIRFCAGVDFLDIDTDETTWEFDNKKNILTLTLKGGYASLDDFKFKREYFVEIIDDGFELRKIKEHYFNDYRNRGREHKEIRKRKERVKY
ncbi:MULTISPECIES: hypothetical protein [Emticicia]|uniref:hypothetical protein n=1 Tax=Emticicia TaxID=312278 RepID=UPI0007D8A7BB|nr:MULTISPECIES: hypothetical protein [Emticicia]